MYFQVGLEEIISHQHEQTEARQANQAAQGEDTESKKQEGTAEGNTTNIYP